MCVLIGSSELSFSSRLISLPFAANRDNAPAAWCVIPGRSMTSKSKSDNRRGHLASRTAGFSDVRIHFSSSWSVRMVNR